MENQQNPERIKMLGVIISKKKSFGWLCLLLALLMVIMLGCSSKSSEDKSLSNESGVVEETISNEAPIIAETATVFDASKIIYRGRIALNTDHYQETFDKITNYTEEVGGFIQESGSNFMAQDTKQANSGYLTIRIPADKFSQAMETIQSFASPINADVTTSNITQQYQDVEMQLNNLKLQEQRLLELLKEATTMTDLLAIESELNRIRTEIDQLTSTKKNWDVEINYATIDVSLYEKEISSSGVTSPFSDIFSKIGAGFVTSVNLLLRFIAFLIVVLVSLLPFAGVALLGIYLFFKVRKKIKEKRGEVKKDHDKIKDQKDNQSLKQ